MLFRVRQLVYDKSPMILLLIAFTYITNYFENYYSMIC